MRVKVTLLDLTYTTTATREEWYSDVMVSYKEGFLRISRHNLPDLIYPAWRIVRIEEEAQ